MKNKKQIIIIGAVIIVAFVSILVFATQSKSDIGVSSEYKDYDLSNGDKVELVVYCDEDIAEEHGVVPKETSKMITVSGLPAYATLETLPKEKFLEFADKFVATQQAENDNEGYDAFTYSDVEIYGVFFGKVKEDSAEQHDNKVTILITYDKYIDGKYDRTDYLPLVFKDILINADGTNDTTYEDGRGIKLIPKTRIYDSSVVQITKRISEAHAKRGTILEQMLLNRLLQWNSSD